MSEPKFVNMKPFTVTITDENNRFIQVHPYNNRYAVEGSFVLEGEFYRQYKAAGLLSELPETKEEAEQYREADEAEPTRTEPLTAALQDRLDTATVENGLSDDEAAQLKRVLLAAQRRDVFPAGISDRVIEVAKTIVPEFVPKNLVATENEDEDEVDARSSESDEDEDEDTEEEPDDDEGADDESDEDEPDSDEDEDESEPDEDPYKNWNKRELIDYARSVGIDVPKTANREKVVKAIREHERE